MSYNIYSLAIELSTILVFLPLKEKLSIVVLIAASVIIMGITVSWAALCIILVCGSLTSTSDSSDKNIVRF